ncbi:P-II family nitrogen regulator [Rhizobium leguminosarum]|uniref:P-II family nitrogen regulator n=1 Tax=Rhizobium TaxID=379 RepID=UPI001032731C|nr:P-II family nitrogen regulator [Rhizobium leguminosarum]TBF87437.1 P-II family nitrogen regulator [Rhizobium leguminosarum]TBG07052.1 P-II family nitrogen regulator [Rhizobium leguminosarum]TBG07798.1 P-II family nitrogen regulator [Rhizobium leguminosarum]TBG30743.1 P-II family nitrogen regulator [Rhizobium leguminosarum]TBG50097.1 P-II family nitrogen regulator [Rhizobium leguminosarum]
MIKVEAIVPPFMLSDIRELLDDHLDGFLVTEAKQSHEAFRTIAFVRGLECFDEFVPRLRIELVVERSRGEDLVEAMLHMMAHHGGHREYAITTSKVERVVNL